MSNVQIPEFIMPSDIGKMDNIQVHALVENLRFRRMQTRREFEAVKKQRSLNNAEWVQKELDKLYDKMARKYVTIDKALDQLEAIASRIASMRLKVDDGELTNE